VNLGPGFFSNFFSKICRTWKVLESEFGPGKSWKLKFKVLESPAIYLWYKLKDMSGMYRTPCVNKCTKYSCYVLTKEFVCSLWWMFCDGFYTVIYYRVCIFRHCWATTVLKNVLGVLESPRKVLEFVVSKRVGTMIEEWRNVIHCNDGAEVMLQPLPASWSWVCYCLATHTVQQSILISVLLESTFHH